MENKKGFTMIEILGVVVIIALISLFSLPVINTLSSQANQNKYNNFLKIINSAADTYIEQNFEKYNNTTIQYIYVRKLIENGYISDQLVNPATKENVISEDGVIVVTKNPDKTMSYEYTLNQQVIIYNIEDLVNLAKNVDDGNDYSNKIVILARNLDFNDISLYSDSTTTTYGDINGDSYVNSLYNELTTLGGFNPIGDSSHPFKGDFVGDGYSISNLLINRTGESEIGLFSTIEGSNISGLTLKGSINGGNNTGLLVGKAVNESEIFDINVESKSASSAGVSNIGGVIGYASNATLTNITSNSIINVSADNVGGIAGKIENGNASYLTTNSSIESSNSNVGGIFGFASDTIINNTESNGKFWGDVGTGGIVGNISNSTNIQKNVNNASITSNSKAGGLFGIADNTTIKNCYNVGDINATDSVGGLVGELDNSIVEINYSNGLVSGTNEVGGIVGTINDSTLDNNYNWGNVKGVNKVGGIVGNSSSSNINRSYVSGDINGSTGVGGLVGVATDTTNINFSYYNSDSTNLNYIIGTNTSSNVSNSTSLREFEMKIQASFINWDFSNIWKISENSYPTFK